MNPKHAAMAQLLADYPGTSTEAQCKRIKAALAMFPLTTFEAMRHLDVYDPRARVMQLRNQGERIDTNWKTIITESGDRHRVGLYVSAPQEATV